MVLEFGHLRKRLAENQMAQRAKERSTMRLTLRDHIRNDELRRRNRVIGAVEILTIPK